jgi:alkylation response protein AidB-like acyl-CoA dehydrogenase
MDFEWADEDLEFRRELRQFVQTELPAWWALPRPRTAGQPEYTEAECGAFVGKLAERNWLTPHWPAAYGGQDASAWQHIILGEELWSVGEPRGPQYMSVNWIGPAIMMAGTEQQKQKYLGPIARGEIYWCQGFSEPDAGSDLASLRTAAVRDGDEYVVNGSKIWTSHTPLADYCFLLVRTDPQAEQHKGISILLVPTDTPGFEMRLIQNFVKPHAFAECFFTDMRVPVSCRLGPENDGWRIVRSALQFERVGAPKYARAALMLDRIAEWARDQGLLDHDTEMQRRLGEARAICEAARIVTYRVIDERAKQLPPSPYAYLARPAMVRAERAVAALAIDILGPEALELNSLGEATFANGIMAGIAAGTYEVNLNLIFRLLLNLPH